MPCELDAVPGIGCEKNAAGLSAFYWIPQADVEVIPAAVAGVITTDLTLVATKVWKKVDFVKDENARLNISTQGPQKGKSWTAGVEFRSAKLRAALLQAIDKANNTDMIGCAVDTNGKQWLLGDLVEALEAVDPSEGTTGGKGGNDRNEVSFALKVVSSQNPPMEYEGAIALV